MTEPSLSLVYPDVIEELGIAHSDISSSALTNTTIKCTTSQMCKSVQNLVISPLSGDPPINLENALTQNLLNVIHDIPTPSEVSSIPGLSHLSSKFPTKQNWPTILLLGRDCMRAQVITQQVPSRDKNQLAVKNPLG